MTTRYNPTPVIGYSEGIIVSDVSPTREYIDRGDQPPGNRALPEDWFYIDGQRYNVHPFRSDLGGYGVRWFEVAPAPTYGPDNPSCPKCSGYNAMLGDSRNDSTPGAFDALKCRDCGYKTRDILMMSDGTTPNRTSSAKSARDAATLADDDCSQNVTPCDRRRRSPDNCCAHYPTSNAE